MQPQHPYTRGLMASIPSLTERRPRLAQIDGAMPRLNQLPDGCAFHPRCVKRTAHCSTQQPALDVSGLSRVACLNL
ncbi:oligopeptide/dipeptide ABC transporter ATP-binding protein [Ewingella americana]